MGEGVPDGRNPLEGEHPDDISGIFGFEPAGDARGGPALSERKQWAADYARQRMREKYPDVLEERAELERLVAEAGHAAGTPEVLIRELKALREKETSTVVNPETGDFVTIPKERIGLSPPPISAIKEAARLIVAKQSIRRLDPHRAQQAERRSAEQALEAAAKGAWTQAAAYKQQQVLNYFLFRELTAAKKARDDFEELSEKALDDKARAKLGKASPVYRDGVDTLLEALGIREPEAREVPAASLQEVISTLQANGETVAFDDTVIGRLLVRPQPWKDLTVAELEEVVAFLVNVKKAASNLNSAIVDGKRLDRDTVIRQLLLEAGQNLPSLGPVSSSVPGQSLLEAGMSVAAGVDGSLLKPETMLDMLARGDLGSMWHRAITLPLQEAKHREADILKGTMRPIIEAFEKVPPSVRRRFMERIDGKALFPGHRADLSPPTRRFELLLMFLNAGNASNMQRLTIGRSITEQQVAAAVDLLTKEELDWAQAVLDSMESLWPLSAELEERDSGLRPTKIEATPIKTRHGTYRGGYFPAVYDRRITVVGEKQSAQTIAALLDPSYSRPGTARGHLKGRVENFADALTLDPSIIQSHLAQVAHDLAFREVLKSVGGLILSQRVQTALKDRLGDERASTFVQWLKDVGSMRGAEVASHSKSLNRIWKAFRSNYVVGVLGYSVPVALGDLANFAVNATLIKKKHWAQGLIEFSRNPAAAVAFAQAKSGEMRFREDETAREFNRAMKGLTRSPLLTSSGFDWLREHAFVFQEWTDKATSTPLWIGAYRQALADGKADGEAVRFADATVRKGFPSHSAVDKAALLRDKGFWGAMTVFYGYFSQVYNLQRRIVHEIHLAQGFKETSFSVVKASARLLALWSSSALIAEALSGRGPEDDDGEDELERYATWASRKLLLAPLTTLPVPMIAGGVESLIAGKKPSVRAAPGYAALEGIFKTAAKVMQSGEGADAEKQFFAVARAVGLTFGVPTRPMRSAEYVLKAVNGDADTSGEAFGAEVPGLGIAKGLIYGPEFEN